MLPPRNEHRQKAAENQGWCLVTLKVQGEEGQPTNNIEKNEPVSLREQPKKCGFPQAKPSLYQRRGSNPCVKCLNLVKTEN